MVTWPTQQLFKLLRFLSWENFVMVCMCVFPFPSFGWIMSAFSICSNNSFKEVCRFFSLFLYSFPCPTSPRLNPALFSSPNGFILQSVNSCSEFYTDNFLRIKSLSITWYDLLFFFKLKFISGRVLISTMQNDSFHLWCTNQIILVKLIQSHWF